MIIFQHFEDPVSTKHQTHAAGLARWGDMYVLLAGEVDIETDLGVVQAKLLHLTVVDDA